MHLPLCPPLAVAKVSFIVQQERPRSAMMNCGAASDFPPFDGVTCTTRCIYARG